MKAFKLTHQNALSLVAKVLPGTRLVLQSKQKWDVLVVVKDCQGRQGRFKKSLDQYIDDTTKRSNILKAFQALYPALEVDDYQAELAGGAVACKIAHKMKKGAIKLWELKPSNKDRIYFFSMPEGINGRKVIFLLMAYHKKDEQTPDEVKVFCENAINEILDARGKIEICEDKNDAKK